MPLRFANSPFAMPYEAIEKERMCLEAGRDTVGMQVVK